MNDDRLTRLLGQVDEPATPDPAFADRLFDELGRSGGRPAGAHTGLLLVAAVVLLSALAVGMAVGSGLLKLPLVVDVTPAPTGLAVASETPSPSPTPVPSATPAGTASPAPSSSPGVAMPLVTPPPGILPPGSTATVVVDGLRLRDGPSPTDAVLATLAKGDTVTIVKDIESPLPVIVSGVTWYWVYTDSDAHPMGWVAAGDGGTALLQPQTGETCADLPKDGVTLKQLIEAGGWHRLSCLGDTPVTLNGVIDFHCQGGARDTSNYQPAWMVDWCPTQTLTPEETVTTTPHGSLDMVSAPGGPSVEPRGTIVRVTGHFDDPAAADCRIVPSADRWPADVGDGAAVLLCREQFVVTNIEKLGFMALAPE